MGKEEIRRLKEKGPKSKLDLNLKEIGQLLNNVIAVDIKQFCTYKTLDEHRLLANTIKHAEGSSCSQLWSLNPSLFKSSFTPPVYEGPGLDWLNDSSVKPSSDSPYGKAKPPLTGDDIYVKLEDIKRYRENMKLFWRDLGEAIAEDFDE